MTRTLRAAASVVALLAFGAGLASAAPYAQVSVVARGLANPRHLTIAPNGWIYVAESGVGGAGPCFPGPEGPEQCAGASGSVTRIDRLWRTRRVVKGLPSIANKTDGASAAGPSAVALDNGKLVIAIGGPTTGNRDDWIATNPTFALFGTVVRMDGSAPTLVADIWANEKANNPDAAVNPAIDSNPNDVGVIAKGVYAVADAGGNSLLKASASGITPLTIFPLLAPAPGPGGAPIPPQTVPTAAVKGPDGAWYVSGLTGFPFPVGYAAVWRVNPKTGAAKPYASGFTAIMDIAFGADGRLYVLEIDHDHLAGPGTDGAIWVVFPSSRQRKRVRLAPHTLFFPGGIAVDKRGIFVTNYGVTPAFGEVLRIAYPTEPARLVK